MHAAFYKAIRPGLGAIYSHAVRIVDHGPYSHCELVFSDGVSASASWVDGGTREKRIQYRRDHWDALALPDELEPRARQWVREHLGRPYDLAGNLRFVLPIVPQDPRAWFCSEFLGGALAWYEPERYGPNGAAALIRTMYPQPADSGFFYAL